MSSRPFQASSALVIVALTCGIAAAQRTARVSTDATGTQYSPGTRSARKAVSADGRYVAYEASQVSAFPEVFVYDRQTGARTHASVGWMGLGAGMQPAISAGGGFVAFVSPNPLVSEDVNSQFDVFVRNLQANETVLVSLSTNGVQADGFSFLPSVSSDGNVVAFESSATTLVPGDTNAAQDVFVRDRQASVTVRASVSSNGDEGNSASEFADVSDDGRYVVFVSSASNLVPDDTNGSLDVFVRDMQAGVTELASLSTGGLHANASSELSSISGDGRRVVFRSTATNLVPGVSGLQIYLRDLQTGVTSLVSRSTAGTAANGGCIDGRIAGNGLFAVFASSATNLVPGDTNGYDDVFVRDLQAGITRRVSLTSAGGQLPFQENYWEQSISADGRHVVFYSSQPGYVPGDTNQADDVFVIDTQLDVIVTAFGTAKTNSLGCVPAIGANGVPYASGFDSFFLIATTVLEDKPGIFFWGLTQAQLPFGGGTLYVQPPIVRTPVQFAAHPFDGLCTGTYVFHFTQAYMASEGLAPGVTCYGQFWSRDPGFAPPGNIGLTDAIAFTWGP